MIIIADGPEKAGKTTLLAEVSKAFSDTRTVNVKNTGPDRKNGFGYVSGFLKAIHSKSFHIWDRGWVSEVVYGSFEDPKRKFAVDQFLPNWFYSRAIAGRGFEFILLPDDVSRLKELRDETDVDVAPEKEENLFQKYGKLWAIKFLYNFYNEVSIEANSMKIVRTSLLEQHTVSADRYIGPLNPNFTFIGESVGEQSPRFNTPFYDELSAEYFRPFGVAATRVFGYGSIRSMNYIEGNLAKRIITVGPEAGNFYPNFPNVPSVLIPPTEERVKEFTYLVGKAINFYHNKESKK